MDFIPDSNIDRKVAKAALFSSIFVFSIVLFFYGVCCLTQVFSYDKTILMTLTVLSIIGPYFYFVTNNRGRNIIRTVKVDRNKSIWTFVLTFIPNFGLLLLGAFIMFKSIR